MTRPILLYGATGAAGRQLARRLATDGVNLVIAGRDGAALAGLAAELNVPYRTAQLDDPAELDMAVGDAIAVVHAAGPFTATASPMMAACIRTGVVYIDISGEWPVFVEAQELSLAAARAGVMLAPGMGFTVAASDCLLALAAQAAPQAVKLRLAVSRPSAVTRGSIRSLAALLEPRVIVRRQSHLTDVAVGTLNHNVDFGGGFRPTTAVSWADVATAEFTTGIGDIETYAEAGWMRRLAHRVSAASTRLTGGRAHPLLRESFTLAWPPHPPFRQPHGGMILVAEAIDRWRRVTRLRMRTADGYAVTEAVISAAIQRILRGDYAVGFRTPASLWTGEFILGLGCAALDGQDSLAMAM